MNSESARTEPPAAQHTERVFYDGHCGLCHFTVRFVLSRDRAGRLRFAPLESETFRRTVPEQVRATLPDSVIVQTADGQLLTRSAAVFYLLKRLGGVWRVLASLGSVIPVALRDRIYDWIAAIRHRFFPAPAAACPLVPEHLRDRFDD
jgi:predicted DCC family thiol-disulfide oxidoreductase YuxK